MMYELRSKPPHNPRKTLQAMIIDLMHAADVAEGLAADPPASADDWPWARQLRFYLESGQVWLCT